MFNDYKQKYGTKNINDMKDYVTKIDSQMVLLNNFDQDHFDYILGYIKNVKVLYLFKCNKIHNLSKLNHLSNLECLHIYYNNNLDALWDMSNNAKLKVLSFLKVNKLVNIGDLIKSNIEYITFDSSNNLGQTKYEFNGNMDVVNQMKSLKHLKIKYKNINIDY